MLETQTLPGGATQLKCHGCGNSVSAGHVPGSTGCDQDRAERELAQREW